MSTDNKEAKTLHPIYKGWDSMKLIGCVKERFQELIHKDWDWRSFYNGWLEGRSEMIQEFRKNYDEGMYLQSSIDSEVEKLREGNAELKAQLKQVVSDFDNWDSEEARAQLASLTSQLDTITRERDDYRKALEEAIGRLRLGMRAVGIYEIETALAKHKH